MSKEDLAEGFSTLGRVIEDGYKVCMFTMVLVAIVTVFAVLMLR